MKSSACFAAAGAIAAGILAWTSGAPSAQGATGTIAGSVTADRGDVRGLRVRAHDTVHKITYTVFSAKGRYQLTGLPASSYEVQVAEEGFESPVDRVTLKAGGTAAADLALKAKPPAPSDVQLVDFDTLFPPAPARDLMLRSCFPCHGPKQVGGFHRRAWKTEAEWRSHVNNMFTPDRIVSRGRPVLTYDIVSMAEKESIIKYLAANFGPGSKPRDFKLDPLVRDEEALSRAMYVEYELPPVAVAAFQQGAPPTQVVHDVFPSRVPAKRGVIYLAGMGSSSVLALDTRNLDYATRTKVWPMRPNTFNTQPHSIMEVNGKVYFTQLSGSAVAELDPESGEIHKYTTPTEASRPHTLRADSKGNIWYSNFDAGKIGRLDAVTKTITEFEPVKGKGWNGYGLIVDKQDRVWASGLTTPNIAMFDPKTAKWTLFPLSAPTRRLTTDSKGHVWACHYFANSISEIDPATGKVTEDKLPLRYGDPYEVWADADDNLWVDNVVYNSLVKFDQKTKKFTYYPFPKAGDHAPKMEFDADGTMWYSNFGNRPNPTPITAFKLSPVPSRQ